MAGLRDRFLTFVGARRAVPLPRTESLAALPLENLSGDKEQDYFADGMTEELITNLAKISALKVISRTSVMQYKGTKKPLPQIAKELNVDAVIEGSVLREGGRVRITAQLIQASTDQHLWAESYERELRSVLAMQSEIANAIAEKVHAALTPTERARLASARPVNPEAYEAYLKGLHHWYIFTPSDFETALQYYELALAKDPNYAPAYAGISLIWASRSQAGLTSHSEATPKAKAAALKAVELDDTNAEAHFALAGVRAWQEWDWAGAEPEFKRAIELNPNYPDARAFYSHFLNNMRRSEEAMAQIKRAMELDPFNALFQSLYGVDLLYVHRYDDTIAQCRSALRTAPDNGIAQTGLWFAFSIKGMHKEALAASKAYLGPYGDREVDQALERGYAEGGYPLAMRRGAEALAAHFRKTYVNPFDIACLYVEAGEKIQALEWLEKGFEVRDPNMPYLGLPIFDSLRSAPRFQSLLRRMNFPP